MEPKLFCMYTAFINPFLIIHIHEVKSLQSCLTLCHSMDCSPPGSYDHGDSPSKDIGVGCHVLLQGIVPTQGPATPALPVDS